jgi:SAM-dependent methyltransferase
MIQDQVFSQGEGDRWFQRNQKACGQPEKFDWACHLIQLIQKHDQIQTIAELGCASGYRLHVLAQAYPDRKFVGVDVSQEAIAYGIDHYPELLLKRGSLSDLPLGTTFDLVIVYSVLHWVDRQTLARTIAEIDRVTRDGGLLLIGDFLPDFQQRCHYHHLPEQAVYTYKQDYAKTFEALGTYRELVRVTFNHDRPSECSLYPSPSASRFACVVLQKSLLGFYPELP